MHLAQVGQRMADQSRHGVLERDIEQVESPERVGLSLSDDVHFACRLEDGMVFEFFCGFPRLLSSRLVRAPHCVTCPGSISSLEAAT